MNEETLRELAEQKEREWRSIQEKRIEALESSLRQKTQELTEQKVKLAALREDFKYNLKLLEERDGELEKYEQTLLGTFFLLSLFTDTTQRNWQIFFVLVKQWCANNWLRRMEK